MEQIVSDFWWAGAIILVVLGLAVGYLLARLTTRKPAPEQANASHPQPSIEKKPVDKTSFYNTLLDYAPGGIIILNAKREVVYANEQAPTKITPGGRREIDLSFSATQLNAWLTECESNKVSAEVTWTRLRNRFADDEKKLRFYDVIASYHKDGRDNVETVLLTIERTKAYSLDEEDLDFIALAAHELRGPITVIRGYLEVLAKELHSKLSVDELALLNRLSVSANRLGTYINNTMNASRYDRRHLKLYLQEHNLSDIYRNIEEDLQLRAKTQNRTLTAHIPKDLPTIAADRNTLQEVITNLVDNAVKYSNESGVISVGAKSDGKFIEVWVKDDGIGIPSSIIDHIFDKFYRSFRSRESTAGTGLGLYLSKAIVESHGGVMNVISQEGHGSTFSFTVPIYSAVAEKLKASDNSNEGIIEDSSSWIKNHGRVRG